MTHHSVHSFSCLLHLVAQNKNDSVSQLNYDLYKVSHWSYAWKMSFNQGSSKQSQEIMFVQMTIILPYILKTQQSPKLSFRNMLSFILIKNSISIQRKKFYKDIGPLRNLSKKISRQTLVTIYKAFKKLHLDYGDILYDKPHNETNSNNTEKAQYDAALAITGEIRGHLGTTSILNVALNLSNLGDELRNWLAFTNLVYRIT